MSLEAVWNTFVFWLVAGLALALAWRVVNWKRG
jgi:hypothetical protein